MPSSVVTIAVLHTFPERAVDRKRKRVDLIYYLTEGRVQGWRISSPSSHFFRTAPTGVPRRFRRRQAAPDLADHLDSFVVSRRSFSPLSPLARSVNRRHDQSYEYSVSPVYHRRAPLPLSPSPVTNNWRLHFDFVRILVPRRLTPTPAPNSPSLAGYRRYRRAASTSSRARRAQLN